MKNFSKYFVNKNISIYEAIEIKRSGDLDLVFVVDEKESIIGIITEGDLKKVEQMKISKETPVEVIANKQFQFLNTSEEKAQIRKCFQNKKILCIPVIKKGKLVDIIFRNLFYESEFFDQVSEFRFNDLGYAHPSICLSEAEKSGKQIINSPYNSSKVLYFDSWYMNNIPQWIEKINIIKKVIDQKEPKVYDLCCGAGNIAFEMAKHGADVTGVDISSGSINIANKLKDHFKNEITGRLSFINKNVRELELGYNSLDNVTMVAAIHHLSEVNEIIKMVYNSLKNGGSLLILDHQRVDSRFNKYFEKFFKFIIPGINLSNKTRNGPDKVFVNSRSAMDNSTEFQLYLPMLKKIFSKVTVQEINAFNAQMIIFEIPFKYNDRIRRIIAKIVGFLDSLFCKLGILKGHEVFIIAEK